MPLFFIAHYEGFVGYKRRTKNVREARTFTSFEEADEFAKSIPLTVYAVLQTVERPITVEDQLSEQYGYWEEHPYYDRSAWIFDVVNGDTSLGYWRWVALCIRNREQ